MTLGVSLLLLLLVAAVLAVGAASSEGRAARGTLAVGAGVAATVAAGLGLFLLFGAVVVAWDGRPGLLRDVAVVLVLLLLVMSIGAHRRREQSAHHDVADEDDHDDGGGWRPPQPPGPRGPAPSGAPTPDVPWGDFDAARAAWGRVPAGRV